MKVTSFKEYGHEINFLKSADVIAFTQTGIEDLATNGVILAGTIYPSNDAKAVGIVFHDTELGQPLSVISQGHIYGNRLPEVPTDKAKEAMKNIVFWTEE